MALICSLYGCGAAEDPMVDAAAPAGTVWSEAMESPLLVPFQGRWRLDLKLTGDPRVDKSGGPPTILPATEYEIVIKGHFMTQMTIPEGEYRLFAAHLHDGWVCARAWHHEDRHDDGDMSKCHVRMRIEGGELQLQVQHGGRGVDLNDPDFASNPPVIALDQSKCSFDNDVDYAWGSWMSYVYLPVRD